VCTPVLVQCDNAFDVRVSFNVFDEHVSYNVWARIHTRVLTKHTTVVDCCLFSKLCVSSFQCRHFTKSKTVNFERRFFYWVVASFILILLLLDISKVRVGVFITNWIKFYWTNVTSLNNSFRTSWRELFSPTRRSTLLRQKDHILFVDPTHGQVRACLKFQF